MEENLLTTQVVENGFTHRLNGLLGKMLEELDSTEEWITEEENELWVSELEKINLPRGMHEAVYALPRHKRWAGLLSQLSAWYTLATGIFWQDQYEHKWRRLNTITFVVDKMGGGKAQLYEIAEIIISPLREEDDKQHQLINEYKDEMTAGGQKLGRGKKVPHLKVRVHDIFSEACIVNYLADSKRQAKNLKDEEFTLQEHLYIASSESSYVGERANNGYSGLKDTMMKSFDNDRKQFSYKSTTSISGSFPTTINWLQMMNKGAFMSFMQLTGLENGLPQRVTIAMFPHKKSKPDPIKNSTKQVIINTARKLKDCVLWVNAEAITKPLYERLEALEEMFSDDDILSVGTHRPYNQIGPPTGVLSATMRYLDNIDNVKVESKIEEGNEEIDREYYHVIPITQDDINLAMLVADYVYYYYCKIFYPALKKEENKNLLPRTKNYGNSRDVSRERLDMLPQQFTTEEAQIITGFEGDLQGWLKREAKRGTLHQISTYLWEKI